MLEVLAELWRLRQIISLSITGAKVTSTILALQNVDHQIDALVDKYANVKLVRSLGIDKTDEIRTPLDEIIAYLNNIAWHTHKIAILPTANSAMAYSLEMGEANWARLLLVKIYSLQADDKLPSPKMPWSRRRVLLVNQRDALIRLGLQMEGAIRRTDKDIIEAENAEDAVRRVAADPIVTKEELLLLNDDWTDWVNTERESREWKARFGGVLLAAKKSIEILSEIIKAGDRKEDK